MNCLNSMKMLIKRQLWKGVDKLLLTPVFEGKRMPWVWPVILLCVGLEYSPVPSLLLQCLGGSPGNFSVAFGFHVHCGLRGGRFDWGNSSHFQQETHSRRFWMPLLFLEIGYGEDSKGKLLSSLLATTLIPSNFLSKVRSGLCPSSSQEGVEVTRGEGECLGLQSLARSSWELVRKMGAVALESRGLPCMWSALQVQQL